MVIPQYLRNATRVAGFIRTEGYGLVSVYECPVHGDEVPLIVIDKDGVEVPNDYFDLEDIDSLDPKYN